MIVVYHGHLESSARSSACVRMEQFVMQLMEVALAVMVIVEYTVVRVSGQAVTYSYLKVEYRHHIIP